MKRFLLLLALFCGLAQAQPYYQGGLTTPGPIGSTTPSTGKFTTLEATGAASFDSTVTAPSLTINGSGGGSITLNQAAGVPSLFGTNGGIRLGSTTTTGAVYINASQFQPTVNNTMSSGAPSFLWASVYSSTYLTGAPVTVAASTYTVLATDSYIIINNAGTCTVTLPTASSFTGRQITIKTITANAVISNASNVVPQTTATAGTAMLAATAGKWIRMVSDASNWVVMESN